MKWTFYTLLLVLLISCKEDASKTSKALPEVINNEASPVSYALVIHGGAGTIERKNTSAAKEKMYTEKLNEALNIGEDILRKGGKSVDAVEAVIRCMEDSPLFNAGKGAVFTHDGTNELDASIMQGHTHDAGAVGGVTNVKNPISAARAVMEKSKHVMMVGEGANHFAKEVGLDIVDPKYFFDQKRYNVLQTVLKAEAAQKKRVEHPDSKHGTVGCVALDKDGHITAGTSTGGMTNKRYNRIGDSPIIGAGTYADERCGVSCTGHGEYFIRYTVARDIAAKVEYKGISLDSAARKVVLEELVNAGGAGGVIALDKDGNISMPFNTKGMYRGYAKPNERSVEIF